MSACLPLAPLLLLVITCEECTQLLCPSARGILSRYGIMRGANVSALLGHSTDNGNTIHLIACPMSPVRPSVCAACRYRAPAAGPDHSLWAGQAQILSPLKLSHVTILRRRAQTSYFGGDIEGVLLNQGAGYGIVVGFGFFFVFLTIALVYGDYRARGGRHYNSEDFNTAGEPHAASACIQYAELSPGTMQWASCDSHLLCLALCIFANLHRRHAHCWPLFVLCIPLLPIFHHPRISWATACMSHHQTTARQGLAQQEASQGTPLDMCLMCLPCLMQAGPSKQD